MKDFKADLSGKYRKPEADGSYALYADVDNTDDIVQAQYAPVAGYLNNPDICALPPTPTTQDVFRNNAIPMEGYDRETACKLSPYEKKMAILDMINVSCPLGPHIDIAETIHIYLVGSYTTRAIRLTEREQDLSLGKAGICTDLLSVKDMAKGRPQSFVIYGRTGCGKTFGASHAVMQYRKAIHHSLDGREYTQIPIIYVTCYVGNLSSLFRSIARELDMILDTRDHHRRMVNSAGVGKAANILAFWIQLYHIGLIIIDEVQYLNFGKGSGSFENVVGIASETGVAFGLIGNHDALEKIEKLPRIYSRYFSRFIRADDMSAGSNEMFFRAAIRSLWQYQWTDHHAPLTKEIEQELVMASARNINLLKVALMQIQFDAVTGKDGGAVIDEKYISDRIVPRYEHMRRLLHENSTEEEKEFLECAEDQRKMIMESAETDREAEKTAGYAEYEAGNRRKELEARKQEAKITLRNLPGQEFLSSEIEKAVRLAFKNDPGLELGTVRDIVNASSAILYRTVKKTAGTGRKRSGTKQSGKQTRKEAGEHAESAVRGALGMISAGTEKAVADNPVSGTPACAS